eukprot:15464552-Alexandrium_andersonii.AAC.1
MCIRDSHLPSASAGPPAVRHRARRRPPAAAWTAPTGPQGREPSRLTDRARAVASSAVNDRPRVRPIQWAAVRGRGNACLPPPSCR